MSEKRAAALYGWLLRLYPAAFREQYGDEALALFRDRYRDERGLMARTRLWMDLLADLAASVPRERRRFKMGAMALAAHRTGMPSFQVLEDESLRPSMAISGAAVSTVAFCICWILMSHWTWQSRAESDINGVGARAVVTIAAPTGSSEAGRNEKMLAPAAAASGVDPEQVAQAAALNLERYYVDHEAARKIADGLRQRAKAGAYNGAGDGRALAAMLTKDLMALSGGDRALTVNYFEAPLPEGPRAVSAESAARYREAVQAQNCMIRTAEVQPDHVGYIRLDGFPDPGVCEAKARAAMAKINGADAIIFDLRENGGGYPGMVALIAAYLFDHPEYLYNPREATTANSWTRSPVNGNRLAGKPVFLLISPRTRSGAEQFAYDLKALKRATLVGEKTGGAAHSGVFHRIDDHFGMGIPEVRAINPFGEGDWEGVGIEPDVKTPADAALATAEKLAAARAREIDALRRITAR